METPLIFLAFANQKDTYLEKLKAERKSIESALQEVEKQRRIHLKSEAQTDIQDIFKVFDEHRGRIKIFHYAGHANGTHLDLEDQQANGSALADLIREENKLGGIELVFLNGCATQGQVAKLLEVGVKNVIATSVPIEDDRASQFARQFYQSLASGASIQEAYQRSSAYLKSSDQNYSEAFQYLGESRSLGSLRKQASSSFAWSLYLKEGNEPSGWTIPKTAPQGKDKTIIQNAEKIYNIDKIDKADFS